MGRQKYDMEQEHNDNGQSGGGTALAESVAARLCHDLAGPVAALLNGLQTIEEDGIADAGTVALLLDGARKAQARLRLARGVFGPGADSLRSYAAVEALLAPSLSERGVTIRWPEVPGEPAAGEGRILALALMVGLECLPRGGRLDVQDGGVRLCGPQIVLQDVIRVALRGEATKAARAAPALMLRLLVLESGGLPRLEESADGALLRWS